MEVAPSNVMFYGAPTFMLMKSWLLALVLVATPAVAQNHPTNSFVDSLI